MISDTPKITDAGKSLLIRALGGEQITFTRFKIGNGELTNDDNCTMLTDLINPLVEFPIEDIDTSTTGYAEITGSFDSTYITDEFRWRELGIFCKGEDGTETLYAYANDGENAGMLKANATDILSEQTISLLIAVGEAKNVTAIISESALYAPKEAFEDHVNDKNNPHKVTAEDVGLGNVPNVSTNDQKPTFEENEKSENIESGDTMSAILGKVKGAISKLFSHITDFSNPHNITANDVGAAEKNHSHSTADISRGTLGVLRGGTGVTSMRELAENLTPGYGIPKMVTGSYVGDGKYGQDNMSSLTFESAPKLLLMFPQYERTLKHKEIIAPYGVYQLCLAESGENSDEQYINLYFTWADKTVWWYSETSATYQLNAKGNTYLYVAFL